MSDSTSLLCKLVESGLFITLQVDGRLIKKLIVSFESGTRFNQKRSDGENLYKLFVRLFPEIKSVNNDNDRRI